MISLTIISTLFTSFSFSTHVESSRGQSFTLAFRGFEEPRVIAIAVISAEIVYPSHWSKRSLKCVLRSVITGLCFGSNYTIEIIVEFLELSLR